MNEGAVPKVGLRIFMSTAWPCQDHQNKMADFRHDLKCLKCLKPGSGRITKLSWMTDECDIYCYIGGFK